MKSATSRLYAPAIRRLVIVPFLFLVALLAPSGSLAISPLHSISVFGESSVGESGPSKPIAIFTKAKCVHKTGKSGTFFTANAVSTDGKSRLSVDIGQFAGFKKEYELEQAPAPVPLVEFIEGGGGSNTPYSNRYAPPFESFGVGAIIFREGGRLLGVGYGPAMFDYHADKAVLFTGVIECEYPKKGKSGKG